MLIVDEPSAAWRLFSNGVLVIAATYLVASIAVLAVDLFRSSARRVS
jgi:hypothetical protein